MTRGLCLVLAYASHFWELFSATDLSLHFEMKLLARKEMLITRMMLNQGRSYNDADSSKITEIIRGLRHKLL
jgi:hypothetical protein